MGSDPLPLAQRAQRIAKTDVDDERPLPKAALERVLIDDERVVELLEPAFIDQRANAVVVGARGLSWPDLLMGVLPLALLEAPNREVEELDRVPAPQGHERRVDQALRTDRHVHVRIGPVDDLQIRPEEAPRIVDRRGTGDAHGHPLGERRLAPWARYEVAEQGADDAVAGRNRREDVLQRVSARPPELVGVAVDDPVRAELRRRQSPHASDPVGLPQVLTVLADQMEVAPLGVRLEDLGRAVLREVVGRDHEVDTRIEVEVDLRVDDVRLVPREECHHELHRIKYRIGSVTTKEA